MATTTTSRRTAAATKAAAEPAMPRQADMTHSDSMDIVTPKSHGRSRRPVVAVTNPAHVPVVTEEVSPRGRRRRRWALLLLILLLSLLGYWAFHTFYHPTVPVDIQPPAAAPAAMPPAPAMTPLPAAHPQVAAPAVTAPAVAAATAPAALSAVNPLPAAAVQPTNLLEVSVGTSVHGGLTVKFDRPVSWSVLGNDGKGSSEV